MPVRPLTAALYVSVCEPTFVTVRVTVCDPARSPIAIDAWLRSLGSIERLHDAGTSSLVPQRKPSQSAKPASKTRPGSIAFVGRRDRHPR